MLARYALMSVLDIMMCVFISLNTAHNYNDIHDEINLAISYALIGLFGLLVLIVLVYGAWRYWKAKHAVAWKDYEASGYL
jgi:hypothetical protein